MPHPTPDGICRELFQPARMRGVNKILTPAFALAMVPLSVIRDHNTFSILIRLFYFSQNFHTIDLNIPNARQ